MSAKTRGYQKHSDCSREQIIRWFDSRCCKFCRQGSRRSWRSARPSTSDSWAGLHVKSGGARLSCRPETYHSFNSNTLPVFHSGIAKCRAYAQVRLLDRDKEKCSSPWRLCARLCTCRTNVDAVRKLPTLMACSAPSTRDRSTVSTRRPL